MDRNAQQRAELEAASQRAGDQFAAYSQAVDNVVATSNEYQQHAQAVADHLADRR
ncbi:hypothetical protein [Streptomyces sp. NPDC127098]|uniref:hypothetical protein n=1 Tax=Streptomyces sp. NPDC127098 TaxID=3347137 RepID=UPI0036499C19